jgi:hypothetical protein
MEQFQKGTNLGKSTIHLRRLAKYWVSDGGIENLDGEEPFEQSLKAAPVVGEQMPWVFDRAPSCAFKRQAIQ